MPNWVYNQIELQNREDTEKVAKYIRSKDRDFDFNNVIKMPEILTKTSASSITILAMAYCVMGDRETENLEQWRKQLDLFLDENVPNVAIQFLDDETKNITNRIINKVEPIVTTGDIKELICNHERLMEKRNDINKTSFSPNAFKTQGVTAWKAILTTGFRDWYGWSINNWNTKWNAVDSEISITNCTIAWKTAWSASEAVIKQLAKDVPVNMYYTWFEEPMCSTWAGSALFHNGKCIDRTDTENASNYIPIFVYMNGDYGCELRISEDDEILYPDDEGYEQAKSVPQKPLPNYDKFLSLN